MKIQSIGGQYNSATYLWMEGLAKYSRHQLELLTFRPNADSKPDLIHFNYGTHYLNNLEFVRAHPEFKYSLTIMGPADLGRFSGYWGKIHPDGIIALGSVYEGMIKQNSDDIPVYNLDAGVDGAIFVQKPPPKHFVVGCALDHAYPFLDDNLKRLIHYGFPMITCGEGKGTNRTFAEMPWFYENISVLVENDLTPSPGGLTPLEAGAVGRPTVINRIGNVADWIPQEFLVDTDEGAANMIAEMHDDVDYYNRACGIWHKLAKSRDYSIIIRDYDAAFESMMGGVSSGEGSSGAG